MESSRGNVVRGWMKSAAWLAGQLRDGLLPPHCLICEAPVAGDGQLCASCFPQLNFISAPFCVCCGLGLPVAAVADQAGRCLHCVLNPPAFGMARAALRYDQGAKKLILPFKYADRPEAAGGLARLMLRPGADLLQKAAVLLPVPLSRARLRERGYNQAGALARALGRQAGRPVLLDGLIRLRHTAPLEGLGAAERRRLLAGAIAVRPGREAGIEGRAILLIDDVLTSGATADSCARALLAAGAAAVDVLVLARVPDRRIE